MYYIYPSEKILSIGWNVRYKKRISRCRNETYFALPAVVRRVTCRRSLYNTAIRGPCDLTRVSPFGSLTCLKLFGIPFREWVTVPVAKVPLFLRSCIRFGLVNQLSIVTWWWSPKWGLIKSITIWYLETYFSISASDAYTSYLRNTIYVTVISPEDVLFEKVTHK